MTTRNIPAGLVALAASLGGGIYVVRALIRALAEGESPGRLGALHAAGSPQYLVFVAACVLGLVFMLLLARLGLRWAGWLRGPQ